METASAPRGRFTQSSSEDRRRRRAWLAAFEPSRLGPVLACVVVAWLGLALVWFAKASGFGEVRAALARGEVLDLNAVRRAGALDSLLQAAIAEPATRSFAAQRILARLPAGSGAKPLENTGTLAALRLPVAPLLARNDLGELGERARRRAADSTAVRGGAVSIPLLSTEQFRALKPLVVVRSEGAFARALLLAALAFALAALGMHVGAHLTRRRGDRLLLPIALLLSALGLVLLVSLRDPLRDQLLFLRFARGLLLGGVAFVLAAIPAYERTVLRRLAFVPLLGAIALSLALVVFGSGPTGSDAKVNLLGGQPMEVIRLLLVFFLAGYFSRHWVVLRELDEPDAAKPAWLRGLSLPRRHHLLPVAIGVLASIGLFFAQRDLGPALLLAALFLSLYAITRRDLVLVGGAFALLVGAFALSHATGFPATVSLRSAMWLDPWMNGLDRGDQVAQGLWAFAAGGWGGTGLGLGTPAFVPAAHTDLILASLGEELGFLGVLACFALYALLAVRGFRIAARASDDYTMFLALGLTLAFALQTLLIASGVSGLAPLSGVVTPFLSYGGTAQLVGFASLGILWSLSSSGWEAAAVAAPSRAATASERSTREQAYAEPRGRLLAVLGVIAVAILGRLAWVQVAVPDATFVRGSLAMQADGVHRFQYNPRLRLVAAQIPRGDVLDRNGVLLATSRWDHLVRQRDTLERLGVDFRRNCLASDGRHYPFGGLTYHLLGDVVSLRNWGASNTEFVERRDGDFLAGYDDRAHAVSVRTPGRSEPTRVIARDMSDLLPLWRHRHEPGHPAVRALLERPRDLRLAIDVRLQQRAAALLREAVRSQGLQRGAVVVLDPERGDLLACVSFPAPEGPLRGRTGRLLFAGDQGSSEARDASPLLDRARFGAYPPGSTFKLVTAAAALARDESLAERAFTCRSLAEGRVGAVVEGRLVRDDVGDAAHGAVRLEDALVVSCNAYFAQLGREIGWAELERMGQRFQISMGQPQGAASRRANAIEGAYGQAQVLASPLDMARVAATFAADGNLPAVRDAIGAGRDSAAATPVVNAAVARRIGHAMREVVRRGTARRLAGTQPAIAGKTGSAQVQKGRSHAWFVGYAPYERAPRRIAFAVLLENGGYGGAASAELAGRIVDAAQGLGIIH